MTGVLAVIKSTSRVARPHLDKTVQKLHVDNPNIFYPKQTVAVLPQVGAAARGTFRVTATRTHAGAIYTTDSLPAGTKPGDLLAIEASK